MYAAMKAQIEFNEVVMKSIRKRNSYFIHHSINFAHEKIPDGTIMFSSAEPEQLVAESPKYMTLTQFYDNKNRKALVMHPNAGAGVNPDMNYKVGIMNYGSTIFTCTTQPGVIEKIANVEPTIEQAYQNLGRLERYRDGVRFLFVRDLCYFTSINFITT